MKKKYFFKLLANLSNFFINLVIIGFVPRALGPKLYGDFNFIQNFYMQFINIFDQSITKSLYKGISQKPEETGIISYYTRIFIAVFLFIIAVVFIINFTFLKAVILPDQMTFVILMGLIWAVLYFFHGIMISISDAYGWTVVSEICRVIIRVLGFLLISVFFIFNALNIVTFFIYHYFIFFGIIVLSLFILILKKGSQIKSGWKLSDENKAVYKEDFNRTAYPLFYSQIIIIVSFMIENWMLQKFSGSAQQGFFSFAFKISQVCFLFSNAMMPLILREFSIHYANNDFDKIKEIFSKNAVIFFTISAFFSCFIAVQAANVVKLFGGEEYRAAFLPVIIMSLYSIHQNYGSISAMVFIASGKTLTIRNLNIIRSAAGIILTFFLIAPVKFFGFNLGASGFAVKMFIVNFIFVNIELLILKKYLKIKLLNLFFHQIMSIVIFISLSTFSVFIISLLIKNVLINFIISGVIYSFLSLSLSLMLPGLFGLDRNILDVLFKKKIP